MTNKTLTDTMAMFLIRLCRNSDKLVAEGHIRPRHAERDYQEALTLIEQAGHKYRIIHKPYEKRSAVKHIPIRTSNGAR